MIDIWTPRPSPCSSMRDCPTAYSSYSRDKLGSPTYASGKLKFTYASPLLHLPLMQVLSTIDGIDINTKT